MSTQQERDYIKAFEHIFECYECGKQLRRSLAVDRTAEQFYKEVISQCEEYRK